MLNFYEKKRLIAKCYKHTTCKFRKKKPMNNSNIDMLVDAELGGGKEGGSTGKEDDDEEEELD
jgi:hypothetical protein